MYFARSRLVAVVLLLASSTASRAQELPWVVFEDPDSAAVCDVVNAGNVELVVMRETDELAVVTGQDAILEGTFVDADNFVYFDNFLTGVLEFATDGDGLRGLWWLTLDGRIYNLDLLTGDPIESNKFPDEAFDAPCDACPLWDEPADCDPAFFDQDLDGVLDVDDVCPDSPADEAVDVDGCTCSQLDDDLDEINNCLDVCPDTPLNEPVDLDGCACIELDDDLDGVDNCIDLCPDTPLDEPVDLDGCACIELDDDLDGVDNCVDLCPNSLPGDSVAADGCPIAVGPGNGGTTFILCGSMGVPGLALSLGGLGLLGRRRRAALTGRARERLF